MKPAKWIEPRHLGRTAVMAFLSLLATNQIGARSALAADNPPDLETIRVAVDSYAQSIKTLEGKYVRKLSRVPDRIKVGPGPWKEDLRVEVTFLADIAQGKVVLDERQSYWLPGKNGEHVPFETHEVRAFDGTKSYRLIYSRVKSPVESNVPFDVPLKLIVGADNEIEQEYVPWDFAGLRLFGKGNLSLAAMLRDPAIKVDDRHDWTKDHCVNVFEDIGKFYMGGSIKSPFYAALDAGHDCLPKYISMMQFLPDEAPKLAHGFEVLEFRKFPDSAGGNEKWFPVRGRETSWLPEIHDVEVIELKINPPIDAERFSIREEDLPEGVKVLRVPGDDESYTGGRKDLWDERQRLLDEEDGKTGALLAPPLPANPPWAPAPSPVPTAAGEFFSGQNWPLWLVIVASVFVLVMAGTSSLRGGRRRTG